MDTDNRFKNIEIIEKEILIIDFIIIGVNRSSSVVDLKSMLNEIKIFGD